MKKSVRTMAAALVMCLVVSMTARAGDETISSLYGSSALGTGTSFTVSWTNGVATTGSRVRLGSVFVSCSLATNITLYVVNNSQTHILKPTVVNTTTALYDGNGGVPVGAGGLVTMTGLNSASNGTVYYNINVFPNK